MGMRQEIVGEPVEAGSASAFGAGAPGSSREIGTPWQRLRVSVPKPGSRFTDEELCERFGVPMRGGIRVSHPNKCIALVDLAGDDAACTNNDSGDTVQYMGQDHDGDKDGDQAMDGDNRVLSRSRKDGYTVLYFTKQGGVLVFHRMVECVSHRFESEAEAGGRKVILFRLRTVGIESAKRRHGAGRDASGAVEGGAVLRGGPDLGMIETVECVVSLHRSYEDKSRLLRALPEHIDARSLDCVLEYLEYSGKISIEGKAIRWAFRPGNSHAGGPVNSRGHDMALANKSILAGTRFEYIEKGKLPTETVGEYMVRAYNADEPGTYTAEDAKRLDKSMRRRARGEYYTREEMREELGP